MRWTVEKSQLRGQLSLPPSKSLSMRAILMAALAHGESVVENLLDSPDVDAMVAACRAFGATVEGSRIVGVAGKPKAPLAPIWAGNSGIVLRFVGACLALAEGVSRIEGDESLCKRRGCRPLVEGIGQLGGRAFGDFAPLEVSGPIYPGHVKMEARDSQPVSALMIATACLNGTSTFELKHLGELPWLQMTVAELQSVGVDAEMSHITGRGGWPGFEKRIPSDFSSLAYPVTAALITSSSLRVTGLDFFDAQGDKAFLDAIRSMGADIDIDTKAGAVSVEGPQVLSGAEIDMDPMVDMVSILAVLACFARGKTRLYNAGITRWKECDRLSCTALELRRLGADIELEEDGICIHGFNPRPARVFSHGDHRMALSLTVAALGLEGKSVVEGVSCVSKSFPSFYQAINDLGGTLR